MERNKEIQEELSHLSPFLSKIREEQDGFKIPDNYFDYLSESIMEQVKLEPKPGLVKQADEHFKWYTFLFNRRVVGFATLSILLVGTLILLNQPTKEEEFVEISSEEVANYIANHIDEFETELFLDADLLGEVSEVELEESEVNQFLEDNFDELDAATLEQLL